MTAKIPLSRCQSCQAPLFYGEDDLCHVCGQKRMDAQARLIGSRPLPSLWARIRGLFGWKG